ncbi:hypothetical protein [Nocardioides cynanchi]|uniref:hypothetical protein n=1 Tax=Nocardioides cynanchi TaxID=2558918 RepID=UPI001246C1E5|nr:hypothetical protein [Nocardioides cynanchi]
MKWSSDELLQAVRATLSGGASQSPWTKAKADLDSDGVLVAFTIDDDEYGVRYPFTDAPLGPNTAGAMRHPKRLGDRDSY